MPGASAIVRRVWERELADVVDLATALGKEFMDPKRVRDVIAKLQRLPGPITDRAFLFRRWAALVQYRYSDAELDEVVKGGD